MSYVEALKQAVASEPPVTGRSREELETAIHAVTAELAAPMNNADRIILAASRSAMRNALATKPE